MLAADAHLQVRFGGAGLRQGSLLQRCLRDARAGLVNAPLDDVAWENAGRAAVRDALSTPDHI